VNVPNFINFEFKKNIEKITSYVE